MSERDIFIGALQTDDPAGRRAYLEAACGADDALRRRVDGLLEVYGRAGSFLEEPAGPPSGTAAYAPAAGEAAPVPEAGVVIAGRYKLLEVIGEGGMGTVWLAEQSEPVRRKVAVKLIKPGMDSRQVLARFEAERQALALMDHPNIAKVLDGGATADGRPFFVMELVKGVPITRYCDDHRLTPRQRLELFVSVCQAVQHAHQKGIIHRDLKPSNVLVAPYDGRPVVKVIDFGVAKAAGQPLTDKTLFTGLGAVVGTPEYMSPEQAELNNADIDTRSDVFSLGVLLYELLAGSTPLTQKRLKEAALLEVLRLVREEEPPKPSTRLSTAEGLPSIAACRSLEPRKLSGVVRGELDWIVMKSLEKDRGRRYETANAFAADVQRYLADEPVQACPPSAGYRFRKFARRNKAAIGVAVMVLFFLILLGSGAGWALRDREAREQEIAQETSRKLALTEQGIRQALDRGITSRAELHAILKKSGGVQQLLNQPARWELFLKTAQGELAQARQLAARAEGSLDAESTQAMGKLEQQLTSDQADYDLARRLEKIRLDTTTLVDGGFDYRTAADEYSKAFAGFAVLTDDPSAVAARLDSSPIKDQLVAALDDWAYIASGLRQTGSAEQLLAVARQAAPDPVWGDRFRQLKVWRDQEALGKLVAQAPATGSTPQLLHRVGMLRNVDRPLVEAWLRQAQAEHPADFWLAFSLADALAESNPVEAAGFFRVALAVRPGDSAVYNNLGIALKRQGKAGEAILAYRKAIELDPKYAKPHFNLGNAMNHLKKPNDAIAAYRKAIELDPKNAKAYTNLGIALYAQKKLDDAIVAYRKAIELDPKIAATANDGLGIALKALGKLDEAVASFRTAIELDPKVAGPHRNLGLALTAMGKLEDAIAEYRQAIKLKPDFAEAHFNLAEALKAQGKVDDAIAVYRKAIEFAPKNVSAHLYLGHLLKEHGNLDDAIACFRKALELSPTFVSGYRYLGNALAAQGKLDDAIAAYRKALELSPKSSEVFIDLGQALMAQGKLDDANAAFENAIKVAPNLRTAHTNLAWRLATDADPRFRDPKAAVAHARKAIDIAPQDPNHWSNLGVALWRAGDGKTAVETLEKADRMFKAGDHHHRFFLAMAYWQIGEKDKARQAYDQAVEWMDKHQPQHQDLRRFRAEAAELLGVKEKKK